MRGGRFDPEPEGKKEKEEERIDRALGLPYTAKY